MAIKTLSVTIKLRRLKSIAIQWWWINLVAIGWSVMNFVIVNGSGPFLVAIWASSNYDRNIFQSSDGDLYIFWSSNCDWNISRSFDDNWFSKGILRYMNFKMQLLGSFLSTYVPIQVVSLVAHLQPLHRTMGELRWSSPWLKAFCKKIRTP
jgi:hypothetical protein